MEQDGLKPAQRSELIFSIGAHRGSVGVDFGAEVAKANERLGGAGVFERHAGFGAGAKPQFWIGSGRPVRGQVHFAFTAKDRAAVRAFHQAALKAGGKDNGPPGLRPHYHQNYYGAFVLDPDGHNIEAVCHLPE